MSLDSPLTADDLPEMDAHEKRATTQLVTRAARLLDHVNGPTTPAQAVKHAVRPHDPPAAAVEAAVAVLCEVDESVGEGREIGQAALGRF